MKNHKILFLTAVFLIVSICVLGINTPTAKATTIQELLDQIADLQARIFEIQGQINALQGGTAWCHNFNVNLRIGDSSSEVEHLVGALVKNGVFSTARGSYYDFDENLASAVVGFQEKYASSVLAPWGLVHGTGYVGSTTRTKLNELYGCGVIPEPYIKVLSPNGGEKWETGKMYKIKWESEGLPSDNKISEIVLIAGDLRYKTIVNWTANDGQYEWVIPFDLEVSDDYQIYVEYAENGVLAWDTSDNNFSIVEPTTGVVGSLNVYTSSDNPVGKTVDYGTEDVELLGFNLAADNTEDIKISGIAIEFYESVYGEILPQFGLKNIRLVYDGIQYKIQYGIASGISSSSEVAPDRSWSYTTSYAWFYDWDLIIPKNSSKTLKLIADIPSDPGIDSIKAIIPNWTGLGDWMFSKGISAHFVAKGISSGETPKISGKAMGNMFYFKGPSEVGSLTLSTSSDIPQGHTYTKGTNGAKLLKVNFTAGSEEDIRLSKVSVKIDRDVTNGFKELQSGDLNNIKLLRSDMTQFGSTISTAAGPGVPTVVFSDSLIIKAGTTATLTLVADISKTTTSTSFQTAITGNGVAYWGWITSVGVTSGKDITEKGMAGRLVNITEPTTCHTLPLWNWDYCSSDCKCDTGEGDCDTDADCNTGYCAQNVGANYGQDSSMDVCESEKSITLSTPDGTEVYPIGIGSIGYSWGSTYPLVQPVFYVMDSLGNYIHVHDYTTGSNGTSASGGFTFGGTTLNAGKYRIKLCDIGVKPNVCGFSAYFTVSSSAPMVKIISPNGGETLQVGETYEIKWTSSGITSDKLILRLNSATFYKKKIAEVSTSAGVYSWTVTSDFYVSPNEKNKVNIVCNNCYPIRQDSSDNYFTIISAL